MQLNAVNKHESLNLSTIVQEKDPREVSGHSHPASEAVINAKRTRAQMNNEARTSKTRPGQIYGNGMLNAEPDARLHLGDKTTVKRNLRRHRRGALPKEPASVTVSIELLGPRLFY